MPLELDQTTPDMSQSTEQPIGAHGEIDREGEVAKQDLEKIMKIYVITNVSKIYINFLKF